MNFITWNVNGIRAILKNNFYEFFNAANADFFSVQETRVEPNEVELELPNNYYQYWNYADKPGYAGTATFTKHKADRVILGVDGNNQDPEGRALTLEYADYFVVNVYAPNAGEKLERLDYKLAWDQKFIKFVSDLKSQKAVIINGDLNIAHEDADIYNPEEHHHAAGFTNEERQQMTDLLAAGFTDIYRETHPDETNKYTWWSYRGHARRDNHGWRLDYFIISNDLVKDVRITTIMDTVPGSDHCPLQLILNKPVK
ncbi:exodeoxyribonuclease III [Fructilactobacillus sp. Tb1]|uniref:exodeoxyribonuclease III n=1 Tax=Fructilactobacillus sp. Tb1 TaxID=3422304 RepID=UPI003D2897A1